MIFAYSSTIRVVLTALSLLFAGAAAVLWWRSAVVQTPGRFIIMVARPTGILGQPVGGSGLGAEYMGHGFSPDLENLAGALASQSRQSARAAICAGISTLCQVLATAIH